MLKKISVAVLILSMVLSLCALAQDGRDVKVYISGSEFQMTDANGTPVYPIIKDGTTYLPVRAISQAFGKAVEYSSETNTVYVGEKSFEPEVYSEVVKVYVDKVKITPKDANGNVVNPFIEGGTTYVPLRALAEALGKDIEWDGATRSIYITDKAGEKIADKIEVGKYYRIRMKGTEKYLSVKDNSDAKHTDIVVAPLNNTDYQVWKITDEGEGYIGFVSTKTNFVIQVSGESQEPGHHCIQWDYGTGATQKWYPEKVEGNAFMLRVKHSGMYMDGSLPYFVGQNFKTNSDSQKWEFIEVER